jgi:hypothetical protein
MATRPLRTARVLTALTALVVELAGVWTVVDPGLLHGPEAMQGSARGTALVLSAIAVPVMLGSVWAASRGSGGAVLLWGGALLYIVYNAVLLLFLTPFNAAFLLYEAMLGLGLWSAGFLVAGREVWRVGTSVAARAPVRAVALYVWVVVALNAAAWLAMVIPALGDPYPTPLLAGTGVQTNAIYVQDLAVWLPLAAVSAHWLRRRQARGAVVVGAVLAFWVLESVSIAVDQWFGAQADPSSTVVSSALVAPFLIVAVVGIAPLWGLMRTIPHPRTAPVAPHALAVLPPSLNSGSGHASAADPGGTHARP